MPQKLKIIVDKFSLKHELKEIIEFYEKIKSDKDSKK